MTVYVKTKRPYTVTVQKGALPQVGRLYASLFAGRRAVVVSDDRVFPLYGDAVISSLPEVCAQVGAFVLAHGEGSKSMNTLSDILEYFASRSLGRGDIAVALGGGVVGDICGFAASVYLRGIEYIQLPTSLLAMVDSSVGGKCAVDLRAGKNLAGAFHQPSAVLCDTAVLATLPAEEYLCGMAEVVKYAVLSGADIGTDTENTVYGCVLLKAGIVGEDELDTGNRQLLNLGHTVGHAIELLSDYKISHGCAVAAGLGVITRAAQASGLCEKKDADGIIALLRSHGLPYTTDFSAEQLIPAMLRDKKTSGDKIMLVIPEKIGKCSLYPLPLEQLRSFIENGIKYESID